MTDIDHRNYSIPLFVSGAALAGAGLVALLADGFLEIGAHNGPGAIGAGLILLFGSIAVTVLLNPHSDLGRAPAKTIPAAGGAIVALLVTAMVGAAAFGAPAATTEDLVPGHAAGAEPTPDLLEPLETERFTGALQGATTPVGPVGGAGRTREAHDLSPPFEATALRVELMWDAGAPGRAQELDLRIETVDGEVLAQSRGASPLSLDLNDLPRVDLRLVVALPAGAASASQDYEAYASYFGGRAPAGYRALDR